MCLYPSNDGLKKYDGKKGTFKFYKVFEDIIIDKKRVLRSPYQRHIISKPGRINLPKNSPAFDISESRLGFTIINGGCFHAYDCSDGAYWKCNTGNVIMPIYVKGNDIIAADDSANEVCFFSYEIKKEDWNWWK